MKITLSTNDIASRLIDDSYASWSYNGANALAEWLEEYEESSGMECEFDACAIRCDFSEYESLVDWAEENLSDYKEELGIDEDMDEDEIDDKIRECINNNTTLIEFDGGIIVGVF